MTKWFYWASLGVLLSLKASMMGSPKGVSGWKTVVPSRSEAPRMRLLLASRRHDSTCSQVLRCIK